MDPGLIWGRSTTSTSGGTMLETLTRFTLPMPAARSALSNAFSAVPPSAEPAVAATFVTFFQIIATSSTSGTIGIQNRSDDTEPKLKRKHFFLASRSSCSIIQAQFALSENFSVKRSRAHAKAISGEERGSIGLHSLGRHLLLELHDCSSEILNNLETVRAALVEAAKRAEATIIDVVFHEFNPFGISGVVVIAESHLSIHT